MYEQTDDNKTGKLLGVIFTLCYIALWVLLVIFVSFENTSESVEQGILIDFGDSELGFGTTDLAHAETQAEPEPAKVIEQIITQDTEPAPEIKTPPQSEPTPEPEVIEVEKPREVNKRALFKGSTQQSAAKSEGDSTPASNQGHELGAAGGDKAGTGQSDSGESFDLRGRNLIGKLPMPDYTDDAQGKVIIRIVVSPRGIVTSASFEANGSTVENPALVDAAISAAKKAKFSTTEELNPQQGTITYIFTMR